MEQIKNILKQYPSVFRIAKDIYSYLKALRELFSFKRGSYNYFKCFISAKLRLKKSLGRPVLLNLEPVNVCNLHCPVCETGAGELNRVSRFMTLGEFKTILDQFDGNLQKIFLYFMGESFLNKDIYSMIRYASDKGIFVSICTNGEYLDPEKLLFSGAAEVNFQISGITQEVHSVYRKNSDLNKTMDVLRKTVEMKKSNMERIKDEKYPLRIFLGLIVMKQNENQIDEFKKLASDIGVDEFQIIDPCVRTIEQARIFLPDDKKYWIYDEKAFQSGRLAVRIRPHNYCEWIYSTVTIQVNGDVVLCCRDTRGDRVIGNVLHENIYDIWNNKKYQNLRNLVGSDQDKCNLCSLCEGYSMPEL